MRTSSTALRLALLVPLVGVVLAGSTLLGPRWIGWDEIVGGSGAGQVYWHLRVPRALLAGVVGAGLAVGGVVFQTLFRNPLATPYTLGVASGASLAAALGFLLNIRGSASFGVPLLTLLAFGGALAAMLLVYLVSCLRRQRDMTRLLLAGVCVAYMCSAGILLVTFLADRAVTNDIVVWMMGSLGILRPWAWLEVLVVLVPVLLFVLAHHRALDLLTFGDTLAATRGVNVAVTIWGSYVAIGVLIAVIVANCGPIGFVGLMVPHISRALFGPRALILLISSALVGAGFLAICDGLARLLPVTELPVGVLTNILGAAFFFYLLTRQDVVLK